MPISMLCNEEKIVIMCSKGTESNRVFISAQLSINILISGRLNVSMTANNASEKPISAPSSIRRLTTDV